MGGSVQLSTSPLTNGPATSIKVGIHKLSISSKEEKKKKSNQEAKEENQDSK